MVFEEKTIESKRVFEGRIINLKVETVEFPDGTTAYRELVEHPGGVGVIALTDDGKIPLVKQFRKPFEKAMYEIPAGKLDKKDEKPLLCGMRELQEETGYTAEKFVDLGYIYPSPGFVDEITYIYFAKGLEKGSDNPDEDEFLGSEITDNVILYTTLMRQRCWFKDTFTTALTNTGDGNFLVPTGGGETTTYKYYTASGDLVNTTDADQVMRSGATICKVVQGEYEYDVPMNYLSGAIDHNTTRQNLTTFISLDIFDRIKRLRSFVQKRLILGYEVDDVVWSSFLVRMSNVRIHIHLEQLYK